MWWRGEMKFLTPIVDRSNLMGTVCRPVSLVPVRNVRRKPPLLEATRGKAFPGGRLLVDPRASQQVLSTAENQEEDLWQRQSQSER